MSYQYRHQPKLILSGSFDGDHEWTLPQIVDDPDQLKKSASSQVVSEWGEIKPKKNASLIHLIGLGAHEFTGPNRNGDTFRADFLREAHPTFIKHGALYRDHKNKDYSKREGDIEKTAFNEDMGRVELLVSADHDKCGDWLSEIEKGKRVDFSMGFDCEYDICSICGNKAPTRKQYCEHVKKASARSKYGMGKILDDGRKCFVFNPAGVFNDMSKVGTGADMIAQHLRKVANLGDDEDDIIGGAELMERLFPDVGMLKSASKEALAKKLSAMEKIVPVTSIKMERSPMDTSSTAEKLRSMPAGEMFGELAKIGCLLPIRDLFQLVMGNKFAEIKPFVDEAEKVAHLTFSFVTSTDEILREVCQSGTFDCQKVASSRLNTDEAERLFLEYGTDYDCAEERHIKVAMTGERIVDPLPLSKVSLPALHLLKEYAAYKLAALDTGLMDPGEDMIRLAATIY
jgi:hypothetical protein